MRRNRQADSQRSSHRRPVRRNRDPDAVASALRRRARARAGPGEDPERISIEASGAHIRQGEPSWRCSAAPRRTSRRNASPNTCRSRQVPSLGERENAKATDSWVPSNDESLGVLSEPQPDEDDDDPDEPVRRPDDPRTTRQRHPCRHACARRGNGKPCWSSPP